MALFSQRKGIKPLQKVIQREAIDDELRNNLWNALKIGIWDKWRPGDSMGFQPDEGKYVEHIVKLIWISYFKKPIDTMPSFKSRYAKESAYEIIRDHFFIAKWWEVYDFIEFILKISGDAWSKHLGQLVNNFLEIENAAYRVLQNEVVEITDENEIKAIESAIDTGVSSSRTHLQRAIELLSDKRQPDYRNSIKESISAVEATCQTLTGNNKATIGDGIKLLKTKITLHTAFEQALHKLYGYTSDESGIRHSLTEKSVSPTYSDAKYMLVICSGFTNYLLTKAAESGIKIKRS